jgi:hypothetical protein
MNAIADSASRAAGLAATLKAGQRPAFEPAETPSWVGAIDSLILAGELRAAEFGARHLREAAPQLAYARNVCEILDRLPPGSLRMRVVQDPAKDVQVFRHKSAETAILLFTGAGHRLGLPFSLVSCWLVRLPAHLILLRDQRHLFYLAGLPSLGGDRQRTLRALRDLAATLQVRRLVCYGNSAGVFAAAHYGVDLAADGVLALAGPVNIAEGFHPGSRWRLQAKAREAVPRETFDLRPLYAAQGRPHLHLVYGSANWDDRLQAEHLAGLPNVTLEQLEGFSGHNVIVELIRRGRFESLLHWLVSGR